MAQMKRKENMPEKFENVACGKSRHENQSLTEKSHQREKPSRKPDTAEGRTLDSVSYH